ncbi:MAG: transporter substrate-binding domain-containing protein [Luteibaculaceae bacterium]
MLLALFFLLSSCSTDENPNLNTQAIDFDLDQIQERGVLKVLIENTSTTFFFYRGKPMGFEYDLIAHFANENNLALEVIILNQFDSLEHWLLTGAVDVIASNLSVTRERAENLLFTSPILSSKQVLVQPLKNKPVKQWKDLNGKRIWMHTNSSFYHYAKQVRKQKDLDFTISRAPDKYTTEDLIKLVVDGKINFTVADLQVAELNKIWYGNIDIDFVFKDKEYFAWAVRPNAKALHAELNEFLLSHQKFITKLERQYFKASRRQMLRPFSEYSNLGSNKISEYDLLFKNVGSKTEIDWELLAAIAYKESGFNHEARSWAGAFGIMQLMPETAAQFGVDTSSTVFDHVLAGALYYKKLQEFWKARLDSPEEVVNFSLASYNVGLGHVLDARKIAIENNLDSNLWYGNVEWGLLQKTVPEVYNAPYVSFGYCRAEEPIQYVKVVSSLYQNFKLAGNVKP